MDVVAKHKPPPKCYCCESTLMKGKWWLPLRGSRADHIILILSMTIYIVRYLIVSVCLEMRKMNVNLQAQLVRKSTETASNQTKQTPRSTQTKRPMANGKQTKTSLLKHRLEPDCVYHHTGLVLPIVSSAVYDCACVCVSVCAFQLRSMDDDIKNNNKKKTRRRRPI